MADAVVTALQTSIAGYAAALAADAASPQPSYTNERGETIKQQEWRDGLQALIDKLQATINARQPFMIRSRACVR